MLCFMFFSTRIYVAALCIALNGDARVRSQCTVRV